MFRSLVSRGSRALSRLDERLNEEEGDFDEGWGAEEREALEPVALDDVDVDDRDALRKRVSKLQGMVISMEEALDAERNSSRDTAQKLGRALQDASTVDGLVDEYGKLAAEASRLSERDARTIAELAAQRDAQQTRLQVFERQLNDQDVQYAATPAADSTKTFASLRAAKAKLFELELELIDARKGEASGASGRLAALDAALASAAADAAQARLASRADPADVQKAVREKAQLTTKVRTLEAELAARPSLPTLRDAEAAADGLRGEVDVLRRRVAEAERDAAARPAPSMHKDVVSARDAARAEADALRKKCAAAEADAAARPNPTELRDATATAEQLRTRCAAAEARPSADELRNARAESDQLRSRCAAAEARPSADALRDASAARDRALRDAEALQRRLETCEGDLRTLQSGTDDAARSHRDLEHRATDAERRLRENDARVAQAETHIQAIEAAADERVTNAETKLRALEQENASTIGERVAAAISGERLKIEREFREELDKAKTLVAAAEAKADVERVKRRKLHNRVMELQGNIRVLCRARPPRRGVSSTRFPGEGCVKIRQPEYCDDADFEFDSVFGPQSSQTDVFDAVADLVTSALDGYSACIFAYGQTGSGKTYTMEGPPDKRGVNVRAIARILDAASQRTDGITYEPLEISMLEIYNEQVRDLLRAPNAAAERLEVTTATGLTVIKGLTKQCVFTSDEVEKLITAGARHRAAGAHALNKDSSRSHSIVTLYIRGTTANGQALHSKLHLVDLAGSERLDKTGATGDRLTEAKFINKSLSALGDVLTALASSKRGHVPYRNSKLTYLLQDSLSGDSKALMFVNVSTDADDVPETLCSLRFAARAHDVALGQAKRNIGPSPGRSVRAESPGRPPRTPERR